MCCTEGEDGAKAFKFFEATGEVFRASETPYENYVSLSVGNTSTMTGVNNSVTSRFKEKNGNILVGFNVENLWIDLFHRFDKSFKRKGKLREYFQFSDQECLSLNIYQSEGIIRILYQQNFKKLY